MNDFANLLNNITPDIYQSLKTAVEIGKWPTGIKLTDEQKSLCMQAVIAYEQKHLPPEKHTGYIDTKKHTHCGSEEGELVMGNKNDETQPLKFK